MLEGCRKRQFCRKLAGLAVGLVRSLSPWIVPLFTRSLHLGE